jgi:hypothetical protein
MPFFPHFGEQARLLQVSPSQPSLHLQYGMPFMASFAL